MAVFLNIIFIFISILFFGGRFYEMLLLVDTETNFLTYSGIVTTPLMISILVLIAVCCSVIIFSAEKVNKEKIKIPVGLIGFIAAILMIITSVLNLIRIFTVTGGFLGYDIAMILSSFGFIYFGLHDIKGKEKEKIPFVLTMIGPMAMCINSVILQMKSIHDTVFFYNSFASLTNLVFFLLLFKMVYATDKYTRVGLHMFALLNFAVSTAATAGTLIGGIVNGTVITSQIFRSLSLMTLGIYSLMIAFYILPEKKKVSEDDEENYDEEYNEDEDNYKPDFIPQYNTNIETVNEDKKYDDFSRPEKISEATIAKLFAQKDYEESEQKEISAEKTEETIRQYVPSYIEKTEEPEADYTKVVDIQPDVKEEKKAKNTSRNVFRSDGSKSKSSNKIVYKAPKKK